MAKQDAATTYGEPMATTHQTNNVNNNGCHNVNNYFGAVYNYHGAGADRPTPTPAAAATPSAAATTRAFSLSSCAAASALALPLSLGGEESTLQLKCALRRVGGDPEGAPVGPLFSHRRAVSPFIRAGQVASRLSFRVSTHSHEQSPRKRASSHQAYR